MTVKKNKRHTRNRDRKGAQRDRFVMIHYRQAKQSFFDLWKRPFGSILTIAVVSIALAMPASLYLLSKNIAVAVSSVATSSQISVYLKDGIPEARVMVVKDNIERLNGVRLVKYISPQQGLDDLSQASGFDQAISLLDDFALPGVLVVSPDFTNNQQIQALVREIRSQDEVTDVRMDEDWLTRLDAFKNLAGIVAISLTCLMFAAVFLIVGNTLRYNVLANKDEIQTMKLIGATDSFILRPYLYSGMWFGCIGALIAWLLTAVLTILMNGAVEKLAQLYDSQYRLLGLRWDESLILLMIGVVIGSIAAKLSAQRHLKEIEPV
ncbi:permease-like cell division protein FtsX [Vibrio salinus]|uniref:permease-like cell division protein FtsX n=1 Tax=Vibrio salinus TaxID=2899784 RepID=UPI001E4ACF26|nr:permease-like cell division protein FtsX [Vibrio salinus]MCE0493532.1 permease-like cell division protein FtsX [Vibrio salinus]